MWLLYSLFSAILTGCVPILAAKPSRAFGAEKSAIIRAGFVLIGSGFLALTTGGTVPVSEPMVWLIFGLAGLFDAAAWLFFYRAIVQESTETAVIGEKSCIPISIFLTCALSLQFPTFTEWAAIVLFAVGILCATRGSRMSLPLLSATCASLQMQLSKIGIDRIGSQVNALFLRSTFSLIFLLLFTRMNTVQLKMVESKACSGATSVLLLSLSGISAFFAWMFCFSALSSAPAARVQAITKLSFWITGLYLSFRQRGINRRHWFGYASMTIGALVLIA